MQNGKYVILYADDDPDFLTSMRTVLEAAGYIMAEAATAEQAINVYPQVKPDLIIVDLMMEEIDAGIRVARELKALGNRAPVYMLSSVGDSMHASIDTQELGLAGVFQKPLDHDAVLNVLRTKLKK
jgi:CheY-like chemotaxis protein